MPERARNRLRQTAYCTGQPHDLVKVQVHDAESRTTMLSKLVFLSHACTALPLECGPNHQLCCRLTRWWACCPSQVCRGQVLTLPRSCDKILHHAPRALVHLRLHCLRRAEFLQIVSLSAATWAGLQASDHVHRGAMLATRSFVLLHSVESIDRALRRLQPALCWVAMVPSVTPQFGHPAASQTTFARRSLS